MEPRGIVIEWVEFTLHPTFRQNIIMVTGMNGGRYETRNAGWGEFEVGVRVKLAGQAAALAFTHMLNFDTSRPDTHTVYRARSRGTVVAAGL